MIFANNDINDKILMKMSLIIFINNNDIANKDIANNDLANMKFTDNDICQ